MNYYRKRENKKFKRDLSNQRKSTQKKEVFSPVAAWYQFFNPFSDQP